MILACERDFARFVSFGYFALNQILSSIPPGAQLLDFLGPLAIAGAYLI